MDVVSGELTKSESVGPEFRVSEKEVCGRRVSIGEIVARLLTAKRNERDLDCARRGPATLEHRRTFMTKTSNLRLGTSIPTNR
jgi:hypothetical protein